MSRPLAAITLLAMAGALLAGCGKQGSLERPAPLFGARAKAQYEAEKKLEAQRAADADARRRQEEQAQEVDPDAQNDNGPVTTRSIRDPAQQNVPASAAPIPGATQGPFGPPASVRPPN